MHGNFDITWGQLNELKRKIKITYANAFVQEKTDEEVNGSSASLI